MSILGVATASFKQEMLIEPMAIFPACVERKQVIFIIPVHFFGRRWEGPKAVHPSQGTLNLADIVYEMKRVLLGRRGWLLLAHHTAVHCATEGGRRSHRLVSDQRQGDGTMAI